MTSDQPELLDFPKNWDTLEETDDALEISSGRHPAVNGDQDPLILSLFAATWADIVTIVAVGTCALLALGLVGQKAEIGAFPWAMGLALMWWSISSFATLIVRRGTPGMLAAGIVLSEQVPPKRVPGILLVSLVQCATLGILSCLGAQRSPLSLVAGVRLEQLD